MHHLKSRHQSKGQEAMMGDRSVTVEIHQEEVLVAQLLSESPLPSSSDGWPCSQSSGHRQQMGLNLGHQSSIGGLTRLATAVKTCPQILTGASCPIRAPQGQICAKVEAD